MNDWFRPAGSAAADGFDVVVTPQNAGWGYSSLRVLTLDSSREITTGPEEMLVVPLAGGLTVTVGDESFRLEGRSDVFAGPSDFAYLPINTSAHLHADATARVALCGARTERVLPFRYGPADAVPVELRGAGNASRLVRNFGTVGAFETGALIACEVLTPAGNWSSYPAHKHDEATDTESELEEIYYFEIGSGPAGEPGFGYHRTSTSARGEIDVLAEVRDRDVALVPYGWHGPCIAAPGFDMYYLNVMAGPGAERAWLISDHPDHAWVRGTWTDQPIDPRLEGRR
ncbi:5-deoxy-glucuronate isomerase [Cryptosporangium aurantiacum]|uniref:5-deoxy-glucuronate isomerase n=1 Tax=Cryptosporangium aurantiacum TaxID=134849 RepID=A0A1M7RJ62_9ACTN|nr:5-deoxy-glucuronate isomerase [Cryptosporangium aurantiacum]SHN46189.1 5-deoxy-glucuronate isomerase [Cryptosporangium aurantiacum]